MATVRAEPLSRSQVEQYERDGFLVLDGAFDDAELGVLRAEADRILGLIVNASLAHGIRDPRADMAVAVDGRVTVRKVQPVNDLSPAIAAVSSDERLVGPMRQLLGEEPLLMEEKLNYKQTVEIGPTAAAGLASSHDDDRFRLHHDWGYYRQQGYPDSTLSSAVALDDCEGRGPIRVIPGSHALDAPLRNPDPAAGDGLVVAEAFGSDRLALLMRAGSVAIFHSKLLHDSEPNRSGEPRRMMIYSHYPGSHGGDPDRRNGALRARATEFEAAYLSKISDGTYVDTFRI